MYEIHKITHFLAIVCSKKYFKAIRKMAGQNVCIQFYEFSLNFVEISTKCANYHRHTFVVRHILELLARWQHHIRLWTIRSLCFAEKCTNFVKKYFIAFTW